MKELIEQVLNGEIQSVKLGYVVPEEVEKILEDKGIDTDNGEKESNGWQCDFWYTYDYQGKKYMFAGSWYYGDYTFELVKEK